MARVDWKRLYTDACIMLDKYQNEVVPNLKKQLESRVEVVRCKDCKHNHNGFCIMWCYDYQKPDHFCSYGERREGE